MGTRSDIIVQLAPNKWKRVYCHWDGYLEGVGKNLATHYKTRARVAKLVEHGDMSALYARCDKPAGHSFNKPVPGYTIYYGRDRGEKDRDGRVGETLQSVWPKKDTWTEFTYVWFDPQNAGNPRWYVGDPDEGSQTLVLLDDALTGTTPLTPRVKVPFLGVIGKHAPLTKVK